MQQCLNESVANDQSISYFEDSSMISVDNAMSFMGENKEEKRQELSNKVNQPQYLKKLQSKSVFKEG